MYFRILLAGLGLSLSCFCFAEQWRCKNDVEVQCSQLACSVNSDFTAMDITIDAAAVQQNCNYAITIDADGQIVACAYTGCWEGVAKVMNNHSVMTMTVEQARWKTTGETTQSDDLVLVLDQSDQIGFVKVADFAQPLRCQKNQ